MANISSATIYLTAKKKGKKYYEKVHDVLNTLVSYNSYDVIGTVTSTGFVHVFGGWSYDNMLFTKEMDAVYDELIAEGYDSLRIDYVDGEETEDILVRGRFLVDLSNGRPEEVLDECRVWNSENLCKIADIHYPDIDICGEDEYDELNDQMWEKVFEYMVDVLLEDPIEVFPCSTIRHQRNA